VLLVIVSAPLGLLGAHGQQWLGPVQRLDLRLLVDDNTKAWSGGLRQGPTISRILSTNCG
jgi:ABC-type phosphonate transport system ATPase subunit